MSVTRRIWLGLLASFAVATTSALPAVAQQTTGVAGSPDTTTTIDGRYLPPPPQKFEGEINLSTLQSKPAWPARVVPPLEQEFGITAAEILELAKCLELTPRFPVN
jgi:hypothetical protein